MLENLLNFGAIFGWYLEILTKMLHGSPRWNKRLSELGTQEDTRVSVENMKTAIRKLTNWKALGPDCFQGHWFKRFSTLHSRLTEHLQTSLAEGDIPTWMTKGRTTLIQKSPEKRNGASNYHPIACLPFMWKLLTTTMAVIFWEFLKFYQIFLFTTSKMKPDY